MGLPDRNMHNGPKSKIKSNNTGSLMLQAIRNFLIHATPSQRCILAVSLNTPFLLAFMAAQSAGLWVHSGGLGIAHENEVVGSRWHGIVVGAMAAPTRRQLQAFFAPYDRALQELLRRECRDPMGTRFAWIDRWRDEGCAGRVCTTHG